MHIISFSTEDSGWRVPRMEMLLIANGNDTGYPLQMEVLIEGIGGLGNPVINETG